MYIYILLSKNIKNIFKYFINNISLYDCMVHLILLIIKFTLIICIKILRYAYNGIYFNCMKLMKLSLGHSLQPVLLLK